MRSTYTHFAPRMKTFFASFIVRAWYFCLAIFTIAWTANCTIGNIAHRRDVMLLARSLELYAKLSLNSLHRWSMARRRPFNHCQGASSRSKDSTIYSSIQTQPPRPFWSRKEMTSLYDKKRYCNNITKKLSWTAVMESFSCEGSQMPWHDQVSKHRYTFLAREKIYA